MTRTVVLDAHAGCPDPAASCQLRRRSCFLSCSPRTDLDLSILFRRNLVLTLWLFVALVNLFALTSPAAPPEPSPLSLLNPLGDPAIQLQDPFILAADKSYYLFGVAAASEGIQCYQSADLAHWTPRGWGWRAAGVGVGRRELHSPQVFVYNGMFCLVYSARMPAGTRLALAASTRPEGPYHDLHVPWLTLPEGCVDGHVFVDDNRKAYLLYTLRRVASGAEHTSVFGVALNSDLARTAGQPVKLFDPDQAWEYARGDVNRYVDSPFVFKLGSKYYLTYSANRRNSPRRAIGYATADKPLGPWTRSPENPLLATRQEAGVIAPGGASVFRSLDRKEWFMVYQASSDVESNSAVGLVHIDRITLQDIRSLTVKVSPRRASPPGGITR